MRKTAYRSNCTGPLRAPNGPDVAEKVAEAFRNLVAVGNDDNYSGSVRTGSWLIESMMIAGE